MFFLIVFLNVQTFNFVEAFRGLLFHAPPRLSHVSFCELFSGIWSAVPTSYHATLQPAIITFLSRGWHSKQSFVSLDGTSTSSLSFPLYNYKPTSSNNVCSIFLLICLLNRIS